MTSGLEGIAGELRIESLRARPLSVPLVEPFVIATGRVDATRAVEIEVRVAWAGVRAEGLGEAACLPPVTREDQPDVLLAAAGAANALVDAPIRGLDGLERALAAALPDAPVTRVAVETAVLDALARIAGVPLRALLGGTVGASTRELETDVTIAIADPTRMGELAAAWVRRGFLALKVKVGKDVDSDVRALEAIGAAAPGARLRVDANAGYSAADALALARACARRGLAIECWEQPCAAHDLEGMREVAAALDAPVIADESVKSPEDLRLLVETRYADGVNLKLAKVGSVLGAYRMGVDALAAGLATMAGGMVETRLGMTAAAHVACALGGVDFVDLDTALLLRGRPLRRRVRGRRSALHDGRRLGARRDPPRSPSALNLLAARRAGRDVLLERLPALGAAARLRVNDLRQADLAKAREPTQRVEQVRVRAVRRDDVRLDADDDDLGRRRHRRPRRRRGVDDRRAIRRPPLRGARRSPGIRGRWPRCCRGPRPPGRRR